MVDVLAAAVRQADAAHAASLATRDDAVIYPAYLNCLTATRALAVDCREDVSALDAEIEDIQAAIRKLGL
jgi:hypothetical protein